MNKILLFFVLIGLLITAGFFLIQNGHECLVPSQIVQPSPNLNVNRFDENSSGLNIIGRILDTHPFVIEVLDAQLPVELKRRKVVDSNWYSTLGIKDEYDVASSDRYNLSQFKFNDIISATLVTVESYGIEFGFSTEVTNIKKIEGPVEFFNPAPVHTNRSGRILEYKSTTGDSIIIYHDGTLMYKDRHGNPFAKTLTQTEITDLLRHQPVFYFNLFSKFFSDSIYEPSLIITCNNYKRISLHNNPANQTVVKNSQLIQKLNTFIENFKNRANYVLTYKQKYPLKDWPYGATISLHDLVAFISTHKLSSTKAPSYLFTEDREKNGYYRENGKIYGITTKYCGKQEEGSWACIAAEEITAKETSLNYHKRLATWPSNLGVSLKNATTSGLLISKEEYSSHKQFYDTLPGIDKSEFVSLDKLLLEDDSLYDDVWVVLR